MIKKEEMLLRSRALDIARLHVTEITQNFEPIAHEVKHSGSGPFSPGGSTTSTPVDQVVDALLDIGSWLLGEVRP